MHQLPHLYPRLERESCVLAVRGIDARAFRAARPGFDVVLHPRIRGIQIMNDDFSSEA